MALSQPTATDKLNNPDHSLMHRQIATDPAAPVKVISVDESGNTIIGDGGVTDYTKISVKGRQTLFGDAMGGLNLRPNLIQKASKFLGDPTEIYRGCNVGYSFPIWNSGGNVNEELYYRMRIPARWDGTTNPQFGVAVSLTGAEDVGDKFKFQLEWQVTQGIGTSTIGTTTSNVVSEQTIITGGNAQYSSYFIFFNITANDATNPLVAGNMLQGRLRRIAASSSEVTNEIAVWDWSTIWKTANVYGVWTVKTNVT